MIPRSATLTPDAAAVHVSPPSSVKAMAPLSPATTPWVGGRELDAVQVRGGERALPVPRRAAVRGVPDPATGTRRPAHRGADAADGVDRTGRQRFAGPAGAVEGLREEARVADHRLPAGRRSPAARGRRGRLRVRRGRRGCRRRRRGSAVLGRGARRRAARRRRGTAAGVRRLVGRGRGLRPGRIARRPSARGDDADRSHTHQEADIQASHVDTGTTSRDAYQAQPGNRPCANRQQSETVEGQRGLAASAPSVGGVRRARRRRRPAPWTGRASRFSAARDPRTRRRRD